MIFSLSKIALNKTPRSYPSTEVAPHYPSFITSGNEARGGLQAHKGAEDRLFIINNNSYLFPINMYVKGYKISK